VLKTHLISLSSILLHGAILPAKVRGYAVIQLGSVYGYGALFKPSAELFL
jgi:hypothetical protein